MSQSGLAVTLAAPMQSWGAPGAGLERPTHTEPTLSGIIGIIANALGYTRDRDITHLVTGLTLAVRHDVPGAIEHDYQVMGAGPVPRGHHAFPMGIMQADGKITTQREGRLMPTHRYYLAGAEFTAALTGAHDLIAECHQALLDPARPLYLGRRTFMPSRPLITTEPTEAHDPLDVLLATPLTRPDATTSPVRVTLTATPAGPWDNIITDVPAGPFSRRSYRPRRTLTTWLDTTDGPPYRLTKDPATDFDAWQEL